LSRLIDPASIHASLAGATAACGVSVLAAPALAAPACTAGARGGGKPERRGIWRTVGADRKSSRRDWSGDYRH